MPTIAFFPWFRIGEPSSIGRFHLVPYHRGKLPEADVGASQAELDHVLGRYFETAKTPIRTATLLRLGSGAICRDFKTKDIETAFAFAELLAFNGLSARECFGLASAEYVNRDLYRLVIQQFSGIGGVSITTRRRDGSTNAFVSADAYQVIKPEHVHAPLKPVLDPPLMKAILKAWKKMPHEDWQELYGAILSFNLANTDSSEISPSLEMILMNAAIEQLLQAKAEINDIARRFVGTFAPTVSVNAAVKPRVRKAQAKGRFRQVHSMRDAWVRDFFALRGHVAHKTHADRYPGIWSLQEHLLLGSFAIPLLAKLRLERLGYYGRSSDDRVKIDVFEQLCSRNLFERPEGGEEWPWRKVLGEAFLNEWFNSNREKVVGKIRRHLQRGGRDACQQ